jgi:hypothetical protein
MKKQIILFSMLLGSFSAMASFNFDMTLRPGGKYTLKMYMEYQGISHKKALYDTFLKPNHLMKGDDSIASVNYQINSPSSLINKNKAGSFQMITKAYQYGFKGTVTNKCFYTPSATKSVVNCDVTSTRVGIISLNNTISTNFTCEKLSLNKTRCTMSSSGKVQGARIIGKSADRLALSGSVKVLTGNYKVFYAVDKGDFSKINSAVQTYFYKNEINPVWSRLLNNYYDSRDNLTRSSVNASSF